MKNGSLRSSAQRLRITRFVWVLAAILFSFTAENIWIDPWLRNKSHRIPSLVPEALSGAWFLAFAVGGIVLILLVFCQILLIRDLALDTWTKIGTGIAVMVVLVLSVEWCRVTNGLPSVLGLQVLRKKHTVTLTWKASTSEVAGYMVYRSRTRGGEYERIDTSPVRGPSYTDAAVESGVTYYYVVRAVNANGYLSANSNEASAAISFLW